MKQCNKCCQIIASKRPVQEKPFIPSTCLEADDEMLSKIVTILTDPVVIVNDRLRIEWVNDAARKIFGADLIGNTYRNVFFNTGICYRECILKECFLDGNSHDMEVQFVTSDGHALDLWCTAMVACCYPDGKPQKVIKICRDITDMKACQSEAMRNAQLASLGELTGAIAHEINNPVTGIINYAQILMDQYGEEARDAEIPKRIMHEGNRIAVIVRQLQTFVGDQNKEKIPVQIKSVLSDTLSLSRALMKKDNIRINIDIPDDFPAVGANPHQLQQVVLNIISNARYALNKKYADSNPDKVIDITASVRGESNDRKVQIIITDHGIGIPSDIINKIQAPFFSTKPRGQATGLGLSISHLLIKDLGGKLWFESKEGSYTKAVIELPLEN